MLSLDWVKNVPNTLSIHMWIPAGEGAIVRFESVELKEDGWPKWQEDMPFSEAEKKYS